MNLKEQTKPSKLIIKCPDQEGIIASVCSFLFDNGANITDLDQHTTKSSAGVFFMRLEFETTKMEFDSSKLESKFNEQVARKYNMSWRINYGSQKKRMAILVSKYEHVLFELIWRKRTGQLDVEIPFVVSNHRDLEEEVRSFGLNFVHIPVEKDQKAEAEKALLELFKDKVDFIVLARYMQILSDNFVSHYPNKVINIHHSFLPAFVGSNPYKKAWDRGVKLIGATSHYITADLDAGPIIEQDVQRVDHRKRSKELKEMGKEIERTVLNRAVKWHIEDRILVQDNKTIIFD